jgi:hypothetical protein
LESLSRIETKNLRANEGREIKALNYKPDTNLYQLYLLNSPKLFNKFTMVNADTA